MCINWLRSSIGKKALMAVSGLVLVGFIISHLLGNLLIFGGPDALNAYGAKLRHLGWWLWAARGFLIASVAVHITTSVQLAIENRRARPQGYRMQRYAETTLAARTMLISGLLVLAYLVYHLLHFTFRITNPSFSHRVDALGRHDIYTMAVRSFQQIPISLAYIAGMAFVCLHLSHGVASAFQTLGLTSERTIPVLSWISRLFALAVFLGYSSIPIAVLLGMVK
ncbi:MAG: succinate dehydrogenase cytochrome b subunit [Candidatus Omnitrophota bacterium]|nr:succinate dehydrogenase cytochrome b subunit [Candidatus Omnitrophota bacterium]